MTQLALSTTTPRPRLSTKLARTLSALERAGSRGLTTMDLARQSESCGVGQDVYHLRRAGWRISCERERTSARGAAVFRWRLEGPA